MSIVAATIGIGRNQHFHLAELALHALLLHGRAHELIGFAVDTHVAVDASILHSLPSLGSHAGCCRRLVELVGSAPQLHTGATDEQGHSRSSQCDIPCR